MFGVVPIPTPGLGDRSYVATDGRVSVVVDPQRDLDRVRAVLDEVGAPPALVLETHIHNDYVTGGLELARALGADYGVAAAERVDYRRRPLRDGDRIEVGSMTVLALATPGHTPHHLSYLLLSDGVPAVVFSGGSLLFDTVGRTDLIGPERTTELTRAQYRSVRRLLDLPGEVEVCPTHGFGSFCSSGAAPEVDASTVERERRTNTAARSGEDEFVDTLVRGFTAYPRYYEHMAPINRAGPPPLDLTPPPTADPGALRRRIAAGEWVVDLRDRRAFAGAHLPGSVNVEGGDSVATYVGWVVPWGAPITLVGEGEPQVAAAQRALARIGVDRLASRAAGEIGALAASGKVGAYPVATFADLARLADQGRSVLDVRRDDEWAQGHLAGAAHVPLPDLTARLGDLPAGELWVHCKSGLRAAIGASLLARAGRRVVLVDDDFEAAARAGLEVVG